MGAIELELRCPRHVNGIAADPEPDWSFDSLLSELDSIDKKQNATLDFPVPFEKKEPRKLRASEENCSSTRCFAMHVSDYELDISDSETDEGVTPSMSSGKRFVFDEPYPSDDSDQELLVGTELHLMDRMGLAEGALHELTQELQLLVSEEMRNKISALEANIVDENEKFASQIAKIEQQRKTQQEREMKMDLQYRRKIAEELDNHITALQRDHEHISQLEEKRIRDDAAREEAKRKEKALTEEKLRQAKVKAEEEIRLQAERAEMAKAVAEAEKKAAEVAASKRGVETLSNDIHKSVDHSKKTLPQSLIPRVDNEKQVLFSASNVIRASERALELEKRRQQIYEKMSLEIEVQKSSSNQSYRRHGQNFNRLIKTISASVENVRTRADELVNLINSPECPQSISILSFAEKVISNCENSQKSNGFIFACSRVIILVTSKVPLAMDVLIAELNRVCIYTVPKYVEYSSGSFPSKEAFLKTIGYKEVDGKIESTDSYVERLSSYMKLYGALVQADTGGFQSLLGLKDGWAWVAQFLNSLPANLYTAVALQNFIEMCGYALYQRYRNQFEKLLRIIMRDFIGALKEGNSGAVNAKLIKARTSILNYIESNQFKKEPEGLQLRSHLESNDFF